MNKLMAAKAKFIGSHGKTTMTIQSPKHRGCSNVRDANRN
jgi:hypothetical protein